MGILAITLNRVVAVLYVRNDYIFLVRVQVRFWHWTTWYFDVGKNIPMQQWLSEMTILHGKSENSVHPVQKYNNLTVKHACGHIAIVLRWCTIIPTGHRKLGRHIFRPLFAYNNTWAYDYICAQCTPMVVTILQVRSNV